MVNCIHHWYLGASHKGVVHARCRKCGAEKDYPPIVIYGFGPGGKNKKKKADLSSEPQTA